MEKGKTYAGRTLLDKVSAGDEIIILDEVYKVVAIKVVGDYFFIEYEGGIFSGSFKRYVLEELGIVREELRDKEPLLEQYAVLFVR